jgi:hypothetical protein
MDDGVPTNGGGVLGDARCARDASDAAGDVAARSTRPHVQTRSARRWRKGPPLSRFANLARVIMHRARRRSLVRAVRCRGNHNWWAGSMSDMVLDQAVRRATGDAIGR